MPRTSKALVFSIAILGGLSKQALSIDWVRQVGSPENDLGGSVAVDTLGNIFVTGSTQGDLGSPNAGDFDAYVAKFDSNGVLQWIRQFGTPAADRSYGIGLDSLGNYYVMGETEGSFEGTNAGGIDLFVRKFDAAGNVQWTRQFGTNDSSESLRGGTVSGLGDVFMVGATSGVLGDANLGNRDVFLRKYDSAGNLGWTRQMGSDADDFAAALSVDAVGNIYLTGSTSGSLSQPNAGIYDAFIAKYNSAGNAQWRRQIGSERADFAQGIAVDPMGNVFASGNTSGSLFDLNSGLGDAYLTKYNADGDVIWARQFGTSGSDSAISVIADNLGNAIVAGFTWGVVGDANIGQDDAFLRKYGPTGEIMWTEQFGTSQGDRIIQGASLASDGLGSYYSAGTTDGSLGGPVAGRTDVFVVKLTDVTVPEPTCLVLALCAIAAYYRRRSSWRMINSDLICRRSEQ